jgi:hypothetical protein
MEASLARSERGKGRCRLVALVFENKEDGMTIEVTRAVDHDTAALGDITEVAFTASGRGRTRFRNTISGTPTPDTPPLR